MTFFAVLEEQQKEFRHMMLLFQQMVVAQHQP
jgi:hypothetical protein